MTKRKVKVALILALLGLGAATLLFSVRFYRFYRIPQNGMFPSLPEGSFLLVRSNPYASPSEVRRGDVVIFQRTENGTRYDYIWRVVALPGDSVEVVGLRFALNGSEVPRVRVREDQDRVIFRETNLPTSYDVAYPTTPRPKEPPAASLTVPPGEFFVLGDNRYNARDSRYLGTISFAAITGKSVWSP